MIPRGDESSVLAVGRRARPRQDLYATLLNLTWPRTMGVMALLYFLLNFAFATAYWLDAGGISNARDGSYVDAFFFSVQTLATIGYGSMAPHGMLANLLVTAEAMVGFAYYGLMTGLMFAKFSRPTARVMFSRHAIIAPHNGVPHLMLRLANERDNRIVNAEAKLTLLREERTTEGGSFRRFHDLKLERASIPFLRYSWTLFHRIDETSPLYAVDEASLAHMDAEIIVSLTGLDETFAQTVHARHSYIDEEILCHAHFADIITRTEDGHIEIHYDRFHDTLPAKEIP